MFYNLRAWAKHHSTDSAIPLTTLSQVFLFFAVVVCHTALLKGKTL